MCMSILSILCPPDLSLCPNICYLQGWFGSYKSVTYFVLHLIHLLCTAHISFLFLCHPEWHRLQHTWNTVGQPVLKYILLSKWYCGEFDTLGNWVFLTEEGPLQAQQNLFIQNCGNYQYQLGKESSATVYHVTATVLLPCPPPSAQVYFSCQSDTSEHTHPPLTEYRWGWEVHCTSWVGESTLEGYTCCRGGGLNLDFLATGRCLHTALTEHWTPTLMVCGLCLLQL